MDIKDKISPEDKQQFNTLSLECQVLNNLFQQRRTMLDNKANEVLTKNGLSPASYVLKFNPSQDLWEAVLKEGALVLPTPQTRRRIQSN